MSTSPFSHAHVYRSRGWVGTIPLPYGQKLPPPKGTTGYRGIDPSDEQIEEWLIDEPQNVALRLPPTVIGFDCDAYDDRVGAETLAALEIQYGSLPDTYRCTSREDGVSGVRLYSVPADLGHVADLGTNVEVVQHTYRYLVVPPSVHPSGAPYRWYGPSGTLSAPPRRSDIPALPVAWVDGLRARQRNVHDAALIDVPQEPLNAEAVEVARQYVDRYVTTKLSKIANLPSQGYSAQWNTTIFGVARDLVKIRNSWWASVVLEDLTARYTETCEPLRDGTHLDYDMVQIWDRAVAEEEEDVPLPAEVLNAVRGTINLDATNEMDFEDAVVSLIGTGPLSMIFKRGSELMVLNHIDETGYHTPLEESNESLSTVLTKAKLVAMVDEKFWVFKWVGSQNPVRTRILAPNRATDRVLDRTLPNVREIKTLTRAPLVRPSGTVLSSPGYDAQTRALYIPLRSTDSSESQWQSAQQAREYLVSETSTAGVFGEFPWCGPENGNDSRATYLALLLTPLLELICKPPWPLFAISAPDRSSGKSYLAECAQILYGGFQVDLDPNTEEFRKKITSALLITGKVLMFDNVERLVANDTLSRLLTGVMWTDRVLGGNTMVTVPNDRVWTVNGNNLSIGEDQRRRTVWITLDTLSERPWERTGFRLDPLKPWIEQNCGSILSALTFMATEWMKAGCPEALDQKKRSDVYGPWVQVVNGILAHSGAQGRVGRTERIEALVENDSWSDLYQAIYAEFVEEEWSVKKLCSVYKLQTLIENVTFSGGGSYKSDQSTSIRLGKVLPTQLNRRIDGLSLEFSRKRQGAKHYKMVNYGYTPPPAETEVKSDSELGIDLKSLLGLEGSE